MPRYRVNLGLDFRRVEVCADNAAQGVKVAITVLRTELNVLERMLPEDVDDVNEAVDGNHEEYDLSSTNLHCTVQWLQEDQNA